MRTKRAEVRRGSRRRNIGPHKEAERAKADERAAARAQKAAERAAVEATENAADTMARGTASVLEGARLVSANIKDKVHEVASDTREAMTVYNETTQMLRDDMQAIRASMKALTDACDVIQIY